MTEEISRPFWKVRRFWGSIFVCTGLIVAASPLAPLLTIGALVITTNSLAAGLGFVGSFVLGYGQGAKVERDKKNGK